MILALLGVPIEQPNLLIDYLIPKQEQAIVEQVIPELTVEEKIAQNFYKCNTETEYIRADTAECLLKPVHVTVSRENTPRTSGRAPQGHFKAGQCTWLVWTKTFVPAWNDASDWRWQAERDGWTISKTPVAGAIAWRYGHVAFTEAVDGDKILISEANYDRRGSVRTIWVNASSYSSFIY